MTFPKKAPAPAKPVAAPTPTAKPANAPTSGARRGLIGLVLSWVLPEETQQEIGEATLEAAGKAIDMLPPPDDPVRPLVEKTLKQTWEPGPGIIKFMENQGYRYEGMEDGRTQWSQQPRYIRVNFIVTPR